jgi:hypothetical protein
VPPRQCRGPGRQYHADENGDQAGGFEQDETQAHAGAAAEDDRTEDDPGHRLRPRQALALLVGDLQLAVDVDDVLGAQPLGEAVKGAERLTAGQSLRRACRWAMTRAAATRDDT